MVILNPIALDLLTKENEMLARAKILQVQPFLTKFDDHTITQYCLIIIQKVSSKDDSTKTKQLTCC